MHSKAVVIFTLTIFLTTSATEFLSYISPNAAEPSCTSAGLKCLDCWTSLNCIDLGDGQFYPQLQSCPIGRSCRNDTSYCENEGNYECTNPDNEKLRCHGEGYFPDPFSCNKYFICILRQDGGFDRHLRVCSNSYVYDPFIKQCKMPEDGDRCSSPVNICRNDTHMGKVDGNSNLFYRCMRENVTVGYNYVPQIYACPNNMYFNGTICRDYSYSGLDLDNKCIEIGNFPNVTNCHYFNACEEVGANPLRRNCGTTYKFDPSVDKCVLFDCDFCRS